MFFFFTATGKQSEFMLEYCKRGDLVAVNGTFEPDSRNKDKNILRVNRIEKLLSAKTNEIDQTDTEEIEDAPF
jgi:single-stranded DNA-binding protein